MRISDWSSDVCSSDLSYAHFLFGVHDAIHAQLAKNQVLRVRGGLDPDGLDTQGFQVNHAKKACLDFRSEEHTSELQSLMRISYAVFCLKKKKTTKQKLTWHNINTQTADNFTIT